MKLLAYLLFYEPGLEIEKSVDMHYKPDLAIQGEHGLPKVWIDCGKIAVKKVDTLASKLRASKFVIVKETKKEMDLFTKLMEKKIDHPESVEYLSFEKNFIVQIADALQRNNEVTLYDVMENTIGVALNEEVFESTLYR